MKFFLLFSLILSSHSWGANKKVYGFDSRVQLTSQSVEKIHQSIGMLVIESRNGPSNICTGNVIGPRHVITSAHCLHDNIKRIHFIPNSLVALKAPISKNLPKKAFSTTTFKRYDNWKWFKSTNNDLALVLFKENLNLPIMKFSGSIFNGETITLAGYPAEKPNGTLWETSGRISGSSYTIDTSGGQSGSAVRNAQNEIVAIHSGAIPSKRINDACVINSKHLKFITYWLNHF